MRVQWGEQNSLHGSEWIKRKWFAGLLVMPDAGLWSFPILKSRFFAFSLSLASSHFSIDWGCATESTNMKCGYTGIAKFISAMCCRDGSFSKLKWEKRITFSMLTINYIWMGKPSEREPGRAHRGYRGPEEKNVCQWILLWSRINTRKNKANEPTEPTEQYKYKRLDGRCCAWHIIRGQLGLGHFQMHQFKSNRTHAATTARKSMRE